MKSRRIKLIAAFLLLLVVLLGCSPSDQQPESPALNRSTMPSIVPLASEVTFIATVTPMSEVSDAPFIAFITPVPPTSTLTPDQERLMLEALNANDCILPCYLGITPGKTRLDEAKAILEGFGGTAKATPYIRENGTMEFSYQLKIGNPGAAYATSEMEKVKLGILHSVSLVSDGDGVQVIEVQLSAEAAMPILQKYWERYSPGEILLQLGAPDAIYGGIDDVDREDTGYSLILVYEQKGILAQIYGVKRGAQICPRFSGRWVFAALKLYDLQIPSSKRAELYAMASISQQLVPIEEVIGLNSAQFYQQMIADPQVCFMPR